MALTGSAAASGEAPSTGPAPMSFPMHCSTLNSRTSPRSVTGRWSGFASTVSTQSARTTTPPSRVSGTPSARSMASGFGSPCTGMTFGGPPGRPPSQCPTPGCLSAQRGAVPSPSQGGSRFAVGSGLVAPGFVRPKSASRARRATGSSWSSLWSLTRAERSRPWEQRVPPGGQFATGVSPSGSRSSWTTCPGTRDSTWIFSRAPKPSTVRSTSRLPRSASGLACGRFSAE